MWWKHGALGGHRGRGVVGCGKSGGPGGRAAGPGAAAGRGSGAKMDDAAVAVSQFLEAVRTGNDQRATQMLSTTARSKLSQIGSGITPPASDTAHFVVGKVEYVAARRRPGRLQWTDLDKNGKPETRHVAMGLRRETEGWRVVGTAATVSRASPPCCLILKTLKTC